jgi:hypothetical protein
MPAVGLAARACPAGMDLDSLHCRSRTTGAGGTYVISGLDPEVGYFLDFADPSGRLASVWAGAGGSFAPTPAEARRVTPEYLDVVAVDVRLPPGHEINGAVQKPDGSPAADVEVTACVDRRGVWWDCRGATSGVDGRYRITGLLDREYLIVPLSDGRFAEAYYRVGGYTNAAEEGTRIPADSRLDLRLVPGYRIAGTVADKDGRPAKGVWVEAQPAGDRGVSSDADGGYVISGLLPGPYVIDFLCNEDGDEYAPPIPVRIAARDVLGVDARGTTEPTAWLRPDPDSTSASDLPVRAGPLRTDGFARVLADDLVVRSEPSVGAGSRILERHLAKGDRVYFIEGPVDGSGYRWYQVAGSLGWVAAAGRDGESWIEGLELTCPKKPVTISRLAAMTGLERVACFGDAPLTFVAYLRGIGHLDGGELTACGGEPGWLVGAPWGFLDVGDREGPTMGGIVAAPGVELGLDPSDQGRSFRLSGHFDDPASADCRTSCLDQCTGEDREDPVALSRLHCRTQFVVTRIEPLE